jgi:hypothetical protein
VNAGGFAGYLARYCEVDHPSYLDQLPAARLRELERAARGGWAHRRAEQLTGR